MCSLPTTLLDDGTHSHDHVEQPPTAMINGHARVLESCMRAYRNARHDPDGARKATFTQAESFLSQPQYQTSVPQDLLIGHDIRYIMTRMGINENELRFWTIDLDPGDTGEIRAVYLAANLNPDDMNNHLVMTTALQFQLDEWRRLGRLGARLITALIQYRDLTVELQYGTDGTFTPIIHHPVSGKRLKFDALERMTIRIQEDGMPLLIAESSLHEIQNIESI
jgi:hypothetical protein